MVEDGGGDDVGPVVVQVLRVAFVLRHLRHLHEVALATVQESLRVGLFQPFVIVWQPVEQVVVVDVHHAVRRLLQRVADVIGPVHVVHGVFAVVAEVEILDGVVDGEPRSRFLMASLMVMNFCPP